MSRTFKSVVCAIALVMSISATVSAAEFCSGANFLTDVQTYFARADALPGAAPAAPADNFRPEGEKYVTLGDLDLSTIKNVLRRTAPIPFGLDGVSEGAVAAQVVYADAPIAYEAAPVVYETSTPVYYAAPVSYSAPVVSYPSVSYPVSYSVPMTSVSTNSNCNTCPR